MFLRSILSYYEITLAFANAYETRSYSTCRIRRSSIPVGWLKTCLYLTNVNTSSTWHTYRNGFYFTNPIRYNFHHRQCQLIPRSVTFVWPSRDSTTYTCKFNFIHWKGLYLTDVFSPRMLTFRLKHRENGCIFNIKLRYFYSTLFHLDYSHYLVAR